VDGREREKEKTADSREDAKEVVDERKGDRWKVTMQR
jgi:hypothetical protein